MKTIILKISGMTCSGCSVGLERYLNKQKNIHSASVNLIMATATIEYENLTVRQLEQYIKEAGFQSLGKLKEVEDVTVTKVEKRNLVIFGCFVLILFLLSLKEMFLPSILPILSKENPIIFASFLFLITIIFLIYGFDILKSGVKNLLHKMPNMDTLVFFSVTASFLYSLYHYGRILLGFPDSITNLYFEAVCMIIYFIKLGRFIETISKNKTKEAIKDLVQITPKTATLKVGTTEKQVTISEINKGDALICKAGEKIAVDGIVLKGKAHVDESFITGEITPMVKQEGSEVLAGTVSYDGMIEYQAKRIGKDSIISEIIKLVVAATSAKTKMQRLTDRVSYYFVPTVLMISLSTFLIHIAGGTSFSISLIYFVTVLVVACPCAIGLAIPLVIVVANGLCAKNGIYLRNGEALEHAKDIDMVVFDKTGTLTYGKLNIYKLVNISTYTDSKLLNIVANLEKNSSHPISTAFKVNGNLEVSNYKNIEGTGISGTIENKKYYVGNQRVLKKLSISNPKEKESMTLSKLGCTVLYVVEDDKLIGIIGVKDIIRKEMKTVIKKLKQRKIEIMMLTGDSDEIATQVAKELGITSVTAEILPKKKASYVRQMMERGKKVLMVGDGINDAVALALATVSVSVASGSDIAASSSDVIIMNNDMRKILEFIELSKRSYQIMTENLVLAFVYNVCMIPIAMGMFRDYIVITPMLGSIAMVLSSITVTLNSLRLNLKGSKQH